MDSYSTQIITQYNYNCKKKSECENAPARSLQNCQKDKNDDEPHKKQSYSGHDSEEFFSHKILLTIIFYYYNIIYLKLQEKYCRII